MHSWKSVARVLTDRSYRCDLLERRALVSGSSVGRSLLPPLSQNLTDSWSAAKAAGGLRLAAMLDARRLYDVLHHSNEQSSSIRLLHQAFGRIVGSISQFGWVTTEDLDRLVHRANITALSVTLDLCCGCGGPTLYVTWATGSRMIGVDQSWSGVGYATEKALALNVDHGASFLCADVVTLPFAPGAFTVVISIDALVHVQQRRRLLDECIRILKPGGCIAFYDEIAGDGSGGGGASEALLLDALSVFSPHYLFPKEATICDLEAAGFTDIEVVDCTASFEHVNRAWLAAFAEVWDLLVDEHGHDRCEAERGYLEAIGELARNRRLGRAFFYGRKQ